LCSVRAAKYLIQGLFLSTESYKHDEFTDISHTGEPNVAIIDQTVNADRINRILARLTQQEQIDALMMLQDMYAAIPDQDKAFDQWEESYQRITGLSTCPRVQTLSY
jgi:hypothetical protein